MLNSRISLVTVPYNRIHKNTNVGTLSTEVTGLICRIPLPILIPHTLGFSPWGTCAGSGYNYSRFILIPFSGAQDINQTFHKNAVLRFNPILIITILLGFILINTVGHVLIYSKASEIKLVLPRILEQYRNINLFPFRELSC